MAEKQKTKVSKGYVLKTKDNAIIDIEMTSKKETTETIQAVCSKVHERLEQKAQLNVKKRS